MYEKFRGWSKRIANGRTSSASFARSSSNGCPSSGDGSRRRCSSSAREARTIAGASGSAERSTSMSTTAYPSRRIVSGSIRLSGTDVVPLGEEEMRQLRGNEVGIIFQDPMTSLNPTMTIGSQIAESLRIHRGWGQGRAMERAEEVLRVVEMPRPRERLGQYPHELSGGLRQRTMIAMALACDPQLLIADEPTTALDVTIQAQILSLLDSLKKEFRMSVLLITHDLGVIAGRADRVCVMYAGKIVEEAATEELFDSPYHPYTEALLQSIPRPDQSQAEPLYSIPGLPPDLLHPPRACRFHPRCRYATEECQDVEPRLGNHGSRLYACYHPRGGAPASTPVADVVVAP